MLVASRRAVQTTQCEGKRKREKEPKREMKETCAVYIVVVVVVIHTAVVCNVRSARPQDARWLKRATVSFVH
jgi:hypothetical protein